MPKKKPRGKEPANTGYVFDYRYTPKPYFTAPIAACKANCPTTNTPTSSTVPSSRDTTYADYSGGGHSVNPWPNVAITHRSGNKPASYSKVTQGQSNPNNKVYPSGFQGQTTSVASNVEHNNISEQDKSQLLDMFVEMFASKIDPSVIEIILQEANYNGAYLYTLSVVL